MGERATAPADATTEADPTSEALATTGLFSIFIAVIAVAVCLASLGESDVAMATFSGILAGLSFAASIMCFGAQARERDRQEAPAPTPAPVAVATATDLVPA